MKRQTPPIHSNPLRSQQSPPSNANTSPQNRIPMPANIPNTFQLLSLQQKASSLLGGNQSAYLAPAAAAAAAASSPSISQAFATAPLNSGSGSSSSIRARASSPLDLSASTPVGGKRLKIESTSPGRRTTSPSPTLTPTTVQHPKTSCSSMDASGSDTSLSVHSQRRCQAQTDEINSWTVDQVCAFVGSIDICAEYVEVSTFFRTSTHAVFFFIREISACNNAIAIYYRRVHMWTNHYDFKSIKMTIIAFIKWVLCASMGTI